MKNMIQMLTLGTFLIVFISSGHCSSSGGRCYMMSQTKCEQAWTHLWEANMEKQFTKICRYFGDVHSCTMEYMSRCQFQSQERELYENDIVKIYTRKPYSCELLGGNIKYKGEYNSSRINTSPIYLYLITCLVFLSIHPNK